MTAEHPLARIWARMYQVGVVVRDIDAVKAQDAAAVVVAFRALFDLLEVEPHEEYENESE